MSKKTALILITILIIGVGIYYLGKSGNKPEAYQKSAGVSPIKEDNIQLSGNKKPSLESEPLKDKNLDKEKIDSKKLSKTSAPKNTNETPPSLTTNETNKVGLEIIVKDEAGDLLEKAKVELSEMHTENLIFSFLTKKDGQAELPYIDDFIYTSYQLKISHPDFSQKVLSYFNPKSYNAELPLIIVLVKGFSVKGIARDASGNFLEGVEIQLKVIKPEEYRGYELPLIQTKKNGVFEFINVPSGKILFSGVGKGQILTESKIYNVPNKVDIVLIFQKGREHSIKVTDVMGLPLAKAKVVYFFDISGKLLPRHAETNENGICTFLLTKERNRHLIVSHSDYAKYDTNEKYNLKNTEPENIILVKGNLLRGKITDKANTQPVPNLPVYIESSYGGLWLIAKTNVMGVYEFKGLSEGEHTLFVQGSRYIDQRNTCYIENGKENIKNIEIVKSDTCQIKLIDSKSKAPLSNKKVLNLDDWRAQNENFLTNEEGKLILPINGNGACQISVNLQVKGYANYYYTFLPTAETIDLELLPEAKLQVFIEDTSGLSLDDIYLSVSYNQETDKKKGSLQVSYNSLKKCFDVFGLAEGKADLIFVLNYHQTIKQAIDIVLGGENNINLKLDPLYLLIFKIKSNNQHISLPELNGEIEFQPSSEYRVYNKRYLQYNDEKKYFEYALDVHDNASFVLNFPQHLPTANTIILKDSKGVSEFDFTLSKGLGIEGSIINTFGQKLEDAFIEIEPTINTNRDDNWMSTDEYGNTITSNSYQSIQNIGGNFFAYGYLSGKHRIKVTHFEYLPFEVVVEFKGQSVLDYQIILKKGSQISGSVSSSSGSLVENAKMDLVMLESKEENIVNEDLRSFYSSTNSKGLFTFTNIPKGAYHLFVTSALGQLEKFNVMVSESQNITGLNIKLEDSLEISGIAVDEQENPVSSIMIYLSPLEGMNGRGLNFMTEASGNFTFGNMFNKEYRVSVSSENGYFLLDNEKRVKGGDKNIKIVLKQEKKTMIKGHVFMPDGKECFNFGLTFRKVDHSYQENIYDIKVSPSGFEGIIRSDYSGLIKMIATSAEYGHGESEFFSLPLYGGQPISIMLKNKLKLDLKVIDMQTRKPIRKAAVSLNLFEESKGYDFSNGSSNEEGKLMLAPSVVGKYKLIVTVAGFVDFSEVIEVEEKSLPIEIAMGKGGVIKGQVQSIENKPIAFISVMAMSTKDGIVNSTTDENGFFEMKLVKPGNYFLTTYVESKIQMNGLIQGVFVTAEEGKEINISQEEIEKQTKTIRVNVKLKGQDVINIVVKIAYAKTTKDNQETPSLDSISNEEGVASFLNVPKGEYVIIVKAVTTPITVTGDQDITIEVPVNNE